MFNINDKFSPAISWIASFILKIAQGTRRRLPQTPGVQASTTSSGTDEPIVFYGEDNEFAYKSEQ